MSKWAPRNREALRLGRDAAIRLKLAGELPVNPYAKRTQARRYFDRGLARAAQLVDELERIGQ